GVETTEHAHGAVGQHDLQGEHVGAGDPVGEAVGPARVVGDVAADRAGLLARRVRGEVQPVRGERPGEVEVHDAGLHPGDPLRGVDLEDAVHLGGDDHDRVADRHGAAGQAGARAPGDEGTTVPPGDADRGGDLLGGQREAHDGGLAVEHGGVAAVERELDAVGAYTVGGQRGTHAGDQRCDVDGGGACDCS